tara:strand:+ start:2557 stop:5673 length:3117 start_codon:yes stop_codon:yes gene_type:complete
MGTSLQNTKIKDTYEGLIKTTDNATVGSTDKELTDGAGNDLNISVNNTGDITADGDVTAAALKKTGGTALQILLADGTVLTLTRESDAISSNDSDTKVPSNAAVKDYVDTEIASLIDSAPTALDTLNELAAALGDDASFSTTITTALGKRLRFDASQSLSSGEITQALTNLGITATVAEVNFIDGVTSNIQTQLDAKQATITGAATTIDDANLTASRAVVSDGSGKIAVSDVTSTEVGHLDGVSSNIQTQINGLQSQITGGATTVTDSDLTADRALFSDSSGKIGASDITTTELGHLDGVTSNIQTQIDSKQNIITGAATTIDDTNLATERALISNSSGKVAVSDVTSTEVGYLDGVTSSVQNQLDAKQNIAEPHSTTAKTFTVTVATKTTDHREHGNGSSNAYLIDLVQAPYINLTVGKTYKFDQSDSSNAGHPLRFYYEADKTTAFTAGVTTNGTAGSSGAFTQIVATETTPTVLYYQCSNHGLMGNTVNFDTRNLTGFDTADLTEGTNLYFTNARADARIAAATTDDLSEGSSNLYFTNARADARIGAASIDDLSDVDTTTSAPSSGQVLKWDGSNFVPQNDVSGDSAPNCFATFAVAGQDNIAADSTSDTLTVAAGSNISLTTNASTDTLTIESTASGGISWQSTAKTSNFTAASGEGYFIDTSSSAVTVTFPSAPSVGDLLAFTDFSASFASNNVTLSSSKKILGADDDFLLDSNNQAVELVFSGDTKGWLISGAANEGTEAVSAVPVEMRALLVGGGGGGGYGAYSFQNYSANGGGGGAGEFLDKPNISIETALNYTVTVGAGGAANNNGNHTSIVADSGASVTFDFEVFGGGHGGYHGDNTGDTGGSSGGAGITRFPVSGSVSSVAETKNEGDLGSRANQGGNSYKASNYNVNAGGGGGAGADGNNGSVNYPNGGNGGDGFQSDITGTNTYYAGGGGGGSKDSSSTVGTGGAGGGGPDSAGSANTGGGGSGNHWNASGYAGGSGVIILRYSSDLTLTETTSPAVLTFNTATDGSDKVTTITAGTNGTIQFN